MSLLTRWFWFRCPKHKHHGAKAIRCAAASAILHFHKGAESRKKVMERLGIPAGSHTGHSVNIKDTKRLQKADKQATRKEKKRRQGLQLAHTRREEALREKEGVSYESGGF